MCRHLIKICNRVLIFGLGVFILSGCTDYFSREEKAVIVYSVEKSQYNKQVIKEYVKGFKKYYPNVIIKFVRTGLSAEDSEYKLNYYLSAIKNRSNKVDLILCEPAWLKGISEHLVSLDSYVSQQFIDNFSVGFIEKNRVEGDLKGLPLNNNFFIALYYREDLLKKYGYEYPPRSWEELEIMSKEIQLGERENGNLDFWGLLWGSGTYNEQLTLIAFQWIKSMGGGSIVEADGTISINNPFAAKALDRVKGWGGVITPGNILDFHTLEVLDSFVLGGGLFYIGWENPLLDSWSVAPLPGLEGSAPSSLSMGDNICVNKYSDNVEIAVKFAKYIAGAEGSKIRAITAGEIPAYIPIYSDIEVIEAAPDLKMFLEISKTSITMPFISTYPNYPEVSEVFNKGVIDVLSSRLNGSTSVKNIHNQIRELLK